MKGKLLVIVVLILALVIIVQLFLLNKNLIYRNEIRDKENAVIIAKAALIQRYGEEMILVIPINALRQ